MKTARLPLISAVSTLAMACLLSTSARSQSSTQTTQTNAQTSSPKGTPVAGSAAPNPASPPGTPAQAQTAPSSGPQATLSVQARLVTLPVTVRDKKGKIITGLTKEDFTLTEDGRPEVIKYLNVDTNLALTLGLVVDTGQSMRDSLDRERSASKSFLDSMLTKPQDKAFLLHFDSEVELLEDLTSSKDKLERALDQLGPTSDHLDSTSGPDDSGNGNSRPRRHGGTTLYDAIYLASNELMRKQQGRKALILLSDGRDRGSKETLGTAIEAAQRAETLVYAIYFKGEDQSSGYNPMQNGGRHRGGMGGGGYPGGGYPGGGYPGGGGGQRQPEEPHVDGKKIMAQIATETGGWFFEAKKKENLDDIYAQISEQLRTQYVLGYTPDKDSTLTGFHKIELTVDKKDLSVQTRPGYYADR